MVQNTTSYNLRNSSDLRNIQARTNIFYNSFLPSTIRAWNELPEETKTAPSVASFKYRLNRDLLNPPPTTPPSSTSAAALALFRLCVLDFEWSAVLLMPTSTEKILFLVHHVAASKVYTTSFSNVPITEPQEQVIFQTISKTLILTSSSVAYLMQLQQTMKLCSVKCRNS